MNSSYLPEVIAIRRLRMRGKSTDPLHDQLRLSNILNSSDVRPRALPQAAILCIRNLKDPLPGTLKLDESQRMSSTEWENAAIGSIERMAGNASRPILGSAPLNADAVLFADRAEFLACLAMDLLDGVLTTNWWWKGIFHSDDIPNSAVNAWLDDPEHVPAALQLLSHRGRAVTFLRGLSDSDVETSLQMLMTTFGLNEMKRMLDKSAIVDRGNGDASMDETQPEGSLRRNSDRPQSSLLETSLESPWQNWAPEINGSGLDVNRQVLLGVGLMLHRAAEVVRRKSFAQDLVAWRESARARHQSIENLAHSREPGHLKGSVLLRRDSADTNAEIANEPSGPVGLGVASSETDVGPTGSTHTGHAGNESQLIYSDVDNVKAENPRRVSTDQSSANAARATGSFERSVAIRPSAVPDHEDAFMEEELDARTIEQTAIHQNGEEMVGLLGHEIGSKFGGVFYLVNLGLLLGLYGDFTTPTRPGISLSIWDFLALAGRSLAGEKIMRDPLWPLLAELAGRQVHDPPGRGFRPASSWRIPSHWLDAFPEQATCRWTADGGRLRVRHPAGFLIVDVPLRKADILQQLATELAQYRILHKIRVRRGHVKEIPGRKSGVSRWMAWFAPYAQARLLRGLGETRRRALRKLVCMHRSNIVVTPTRIDVEFELNRLPIQVRLCGLDRDPGWVPAAGRFVSFQYR
jgi:hypothetical protein